jgi:tRNA U38,U39,U40 pseudouridine synthase TruA
MLDNNDMIDVPQESTDVRRALTMKDYKYFKNRLDSQSRRIEKLQSKLAQIISNHRYYVQKRLPAVLEREQTKVRFSVVLKKAEQVLRSFGKHHFTLLSKSKDSQKRQDRFVGLFTHVEMQRLRRLLQSDLHGLKKITKKT